MSTSEALEPLQNGLCVPGAAFNLAIRCEELGIALSIASDGRLVTHGTLTPDLRSELARLKYHMLLLVQYQPSDRHLRDDDAPRPTLGPIRVAA